MTGRTVPEWIGKSPNTPIPPKVKARIWVREGGRCSLTGRKIGVGELFDFEHRIPLSMGGEHRETNICLALKEAHKRKTAAEATARAKADRVRQKHLGIYPKTKRPMQSRPFPKSRKGIG